MGRKWGLAIPLTLGERLNKRRVPAVECLRGPRFFQAQSSSWLPQALAVKDLRHPKRLGKGRPRRLAAPGVF